MELTREKCIVYLDDVLVLGHTFGEHLSNLWGVFSRLHRAGLKLKPSKCKLSCPYRGPYRIVELYPNGADLCPVDRPRMKEIRVALNRLRRCPAEISTGREI